MPGFFIFIFVRGSGFLRFCLLCEKITGMLCDCGKFVKVVSISCVAAGLVSFGCEKKQEVPEAPQQKEVPAVMETAPAGSAQELKVLEAVPTVQTNVLAEIPAESAQAAEAEKPAAIEATPILPTELAVATEEKTAPEPAKQEAETKELAQKATEQAQIEEWFLQGVNYYSGKGVEKDRAKAVEYFQKAAEKGHTQALFNLGVCSVLGTGCDRDMVKAVEYFKKSADGGNMDAAFNLAIHYGKGEGVERDMAKSAEYMRMAADADIPEAAYHLAVMYATGDGVERNESEAFKLFKKVAEWGYPNAQANLGTYYLQGIGTEANPAEAEKWFLKAAGQGNVTAQFNLGIFYAQGRGGVTNLVEAYKWCSLAADQGDLQAESNRDVILGDMTPKQVAEGVRAASDFTFKKFKELREEGIIEIDPDVLKPITDETDEGEIKKPQPDIKNILPTESRPVLENPLEPQKARDTRD